jgi:hypothetical protein
VISIQVLENTSTIQELQHKIDQLETVLFFSSLSSMQTIEFKFETLSYNTNAFFEWNVAKTFLRRGVEISFFTKLRLSTRDSNFKIEIERI